MTMSKCIDIRTGEKYMLTIKEATDCRQSPGICRDFYYEHCLLV